MQYVFLSRIFYSQKKVAIYLIADLFIFLLNLAFLRLFNSDLFSILVFDFNRRYITSL